MTKKSHDWESGAVLEDHTKKKLDILREYFRQYLIIRCQLPCQEVFRLAIVDGFAGGGIYKCGRYGSPLVFLDVLIKTENEINLKRINQSIRPIKIECLFILNDFDLSAVGELKRNIAPFLIEVKNESSNVLVETQFFNEPFESLYPKVKERLISARCRNVVFNLDQYGYSGVTSNIIRDILNSWRSAEVLLTFMISSLLTYLSPKKEASNVPLEPEVRMKIDALLDDNDELFTKKEWLGEAEKIVYDHLKSSATYVSPFSINNPDGWCYWLMHFANNYRARQVFNDILHQDGLSQAHYGRTGLNMLSYNPQNEGQLYLFDNDSRLSAKESLYDDIPRFIAESGDSLSVQDFYAAAYSETPAHSDDIHEMIIENPDMEVITESGGKRRLANTIKPSDTLRLTSQKNIIFMFSNPPTKK